MQIIAEQKNTRQSPRKVRLVANTVRKMSLEHALRQLSVMEKRPSLVVSKVIRQALANAWHNHNLSLEELELKNILVNVGPTYKRWRAVSRGRAHNIFKRTSHIRVILETKPESKPVEKKASAKADKPAKASKPAKQTAEKAGTKAGQKDVSDAKAQSGMRAPQKEAAPRTALPKQTTTQQKVVKKAS